MNKVLKNHDRIKRRRNFFPALAASFAFWGILGWYILTVPPAGNWQICVFCFLFFGAVFLTISLLLANSRRGLLAAVGGVGFFVFQYHKLANVLNLLILASLLVCLEIYFSKR